MKKKISELIAGYMSKHADDQEKISEFSNFIDTFFEDMDEELIDVKEAFYDELNEEGCASNGVAVKAVQRFIDEF